MPEITSVALLSIFKPLVFFLVLVGWAWLVGQLDKDAAYYQLHRRLWSGAHLATGALAFGLWLLIPWFWAGFPLVLALLIGEAVGYAFYHNAQLPEEAQWELSLETLTQRMDAYQQAQAQSRSRVALLDREGAPMPVPSGDEGRAAAHRALEEVLAYAVPREADSVEVNVGHEQASLAAQIDGVRFPQDELDARTGGMLVSYVKECAGLDPSELRRRQSGRLHITSEPLGNHELGLETWGSTKGLGLRLTLDPRARLSRPFEKLGFTETQQQSLTQALDHASRGICLVASPPHQGQTTTLYALLSRHDPYTTSVVTLEPEVEEELEGVSHHAIGDEDEDALVKRVGNLRRRGADVMMLGRLPGAGVARAIAESEEDPVAYVGLNASDTFQALKQWANVVGDLQHAAEPIVAVVAQRLVRLLCPTCRTPYKPDPDALRKMNLSAEKVTRLYKHSGRITMREKEQTCPHCLGIGYKGRIGVYEVMGLDDTARQLCGEGKLEQLRGHLRKNQMMYLQEAALTRVVSGETSISEMTRVFSQQQKGKGKQGGGEPSGSGSKTGGGSKGGSGSKSGNQGASSGGKAGE
jgi:type II secretory ATPase GspE/PulE/Tfp pilus assembly ATPase PilB-like protein